MTTYLIDSSVIIHHLKNVPTARKRLDQLSPSGIATSIICYMEVFQGVDRSDRPQEALRTFHAFFRGVPALPITKSINRSPNVALA